MCALHKLLGCEFVDEGCDFLVRQRLNNLHPLSSSNRPRIRKVVLNLVAGRSTAKGYAQAVLIIERPETQAATRSRPPY
ncbi:hypothetical protein ED28_08035 [[Pantoea] beijingensis]|uniref:Uncharacterized protein n=1 Tax=[Pantoea] beijingensis TaxID=1324864 RepID=A0A443IE60_9GAMM|nr:hypothetical protein [[Pantoea] beijingensis]RWR02320.1 hypothetical protein ED28_08035 [[Pantoea] beijingensis]